jgi:hypothetical protein
LGIRESRQPDALAVKGQEETDLFALRRRATGSRQGHPSRRQQDPSGDDVRQALAAGHRREGLDLLSISISADFGRAIRFGATHVRVGTAIFGARGEAV